MDFESETFIAYRTTGNDGAYETGDRIGALNTGTDPAAHILAGAVGVRRLTPRECERLQGFPDDYTAITYRGKSAADGPRYKALGNSMAISVIRWLGERICAALVRANYASDQATVRKSRMVRAEADLFGEAARPPILTASTPCYPV
jgi:DNA (cytosine-5)-methyltransferase 1